MNRYYLKKIIINVKKKNYNTVNLKLTTIYKKKKLKKLIVKDGIISIPFNVNDLFPKDGRQRLSCGLCSTNDCYHINYIYNKLFDIDINLVHLLYCNDFKYNLIDFDINEFYDYCYKYLDDNECCYCLDKLNTKYDFWCCNNCKHLVHNKCISEWIKKNNECPLCKQKINKIFGFH